MTSNVLSKHTISGVRENAVVNFGFKFTIPLSRLVNFDRYRPALSSSDRPSPFLT